MSIASFSAESGPNLHCQGLRTGLKMRDEASEKSADLGSYQNGCAQPRRNADLQQK